MGEAPKGPGETPPGPAPDAASDAASAEEREATRGLSDFVRRAVSVGVGAAQRSKDDIMRAAGTEVRSWLDRLNVHDELVKLFSKMTVEIKAEIRFKPRAEKGGSDSKSATEPRDAAPEPVAEPGSRPERQA